MAQKTLKSCLSMQGRRNARTGKTLYPILPGSLLVGLEVFANYLVRLERINALPRIVIRDWSTAAETTIRFDEEAYSLGLEGGFEYQTDKL